MMLFTWDQGTGRGPPVQGKPWTSSRHKKKVHHVLTGAVMMMKMARWGR